MTLSSILTPENVVFLEAGLNREETVRRLAERIQPQVAGLVTPKALTARLAEAEKLNQVLESGFFIPHAKFPELCGFHAVLGISKDGFKDPSTGLIVKVSLLLLSPHKPAYFQKHLNMLSMLSQTFQPALVDKLAALTDAAQACALLKGK